MNQRYAKPNRWRKVLTTNSGMTWRFTYGGHTTVSVGPAGIRESTNMILLADHNMTPADVNDEWLAAQAEAWIGRENEKGN